MAFSAYCPSQVSASRCWMSCCGERIRERRCPPHFPRRRLEYSQRYSRSTTRSRAHHPLLTGDFRDASQIGQYFPHVSVVEKTEHIRRHSHDTSVVWPDSVPDDSLQLCVGVLADSNRKIRRGDPREHRLIDEHVPFELIAVTSGATADPRQPCTLRNRRRVRWDRDWPAGLFVSASHSHLRHCKDGERGNDDQAEQPSNAISQPADRPSHDVLEVKGVVSMLPITVPAAMAAAQIPSVVTTTIVAR